MLPLLLLWGSLLSGVVSSRLTPKKLFGEITSPRYPKPYPNNNISTWDITVPKGFVVKLNFWLFDLEPSESCLYDYVKITADKKDLGRYCGRQGSATGNHPGAREFVSKGNRMRLMFHSDFSNEENGTIIPYKGFLAYYQAVDLDECAPGNAIEEDEGPVCQHLCHNYVGGYLCSCRPGYQLQSNHHSCRVECSSELFTEAFGYLSSPEYPLPYPTQLRCNYSIRLERGLVVTLKFLEPFDIDEHQQVHCPYDQLKIQAKGREIGEFCGKVSPGIIETNSNEVDVLFFSDESGFSRGWKIRYSSERIRCPQPVPRDRFTLIKDLQPLYHFRDYFIVSCQTGYNLMEGDQKLPSFTAVCQDDGTWHRPMPWCKIVSCGNPKNLTNGAFHYVREPGNNNYQSEVTYQCNQPYYHMVTHGGNGTYSCSAQGSWVDQGGQEEIPVCLPPVDCSPPSTIANGKATYKSGSEETQYGAIVRYVCEEPYYALQTRGDGEYQCSDNGKWVSKEMGTELPACVPVCGFPSTPIQDQQRIFGGTRAKPGNFPWQVFFPNPRGGGVLISERWVLTAAHVLDDSRGKSIMYAGVTNIRHHSQDEEAIQLEEDKVFIHPGWTKVADPDTRTNFDNDIAFVRLKEPVKMGPRISPLCLPGGSPEYELTDGRVGYISGWGRTEKRDRVQHLMMAQIPVVTREKCRSVKPRPPADATTFHFTENMICAGDGRKDSCSGDGGGAFAITDPHNDSRYYVGGLVSWGPQCGTYGLYTRVGCYRDWILETMRLYGEAKESQE